MRFVFLLLFISSLMAHVVPGVDVFFDDKRYQTWEGKRIGLLTNHTGVDRQMRSTVERFLESEGPYKLTALFSPEHGLFGQHYAWESVKHQHLGDLPVYSLHGETRRPTPEMLEKIDVLVYDIQCTGVRAYTYPT